MKLAGSEYYHEVAWLNSRLFDSAVVLIRRRVTRCGACKEIRYLVHTIVS